MEDYGKKKPVIAQIEALTGETLALNMHVRESEENTEAIAILSRFHKDQCIVCDTRSIDWEALLAAKTTNRDTVKEALDPKIKELLEEITNLSFGADPFNLRARLLQTIEDGDMTIVADILAEIAVYSIFLPAFSRMRLLTLTSRGILLPHSVSITN